MAVREASIAAHSVLLQANERWPDRSRISDGLLPSAAHHLANPNSSHERGLAVDITAALKPSKVTPTGDEIVEILLARCRSGEENRLWYIIWNRHIWSKTYGWVKRPYTGASPHTEHVHLDILPEWRDNDSPWFVTISPGELMAAEWSDQMGHEEDSNGKPVTYGIAMQRMYSWLKALNAKLN